MSYVRTGHHAYAQYGIESTFKTFPAMSRAFGYNVSVSQLDFKNTLLKLGSIGSPVYEKFAFANFEGSFNVEWVLSNPWWLELIYDPPSSTGTAPTVHVYPNQTNFPNTVPKELKTFGVEVGIAQPSPSNMVLQYAGCIMAQHTISARLNDFVTCRAQVMYAKTPVVATTLDTTLPTDDVAFPYTYIHGTITLAGIAVGTIQTIELTQNLNGNLLWGFGSAEAEDKYRGMMDVSGKFNCAFKNKDLLQLALDKQEPTTNTVQLVFSNGGSGATLKSLTFDGTGIGIPNHTIPEIKRGEAIFQDVPFDVRIPMWTARNQTATPP